MCAGVSISLISKEVKNLHIIYPHLLNRYIDVPIRDPLDSDHSGMSSHSRSAANDYFESLTFMPSPPQIVNAAPTSNPTTDYRTIKISDAWKKSL